MVLVILALLAAVSWPALMRPWQKSRVQGAAQQLAEVVRRARLDAIESGQVLRLRWNWSQSDFHVELVDTRPRGDRTGNPPVAAGTAEKMPSRRRRTGVTLHERLPEGVVFALPNAPHSQGTLDVAHRHAPDDTTGDRTTGPRITSPTESNAIGADATNTGTRQDATPLSATETDPHQPPTPPVYFYPDGRSSSATWRLLADDGYTLTVTLRGLTGSVRVGPIRNRPPTGGDQP